LKGRRCPLETLWVGGERGGEETRCDEEEKREREEGRKGTHGW
jgi:hypothetical protein